MKRKILLGIMSIFFVGLFFAPKALGATTVVGPFDDVCQQANSAERPSVCKENDNPATNNLNPFTGQGGILLRAVRIFTFITGVSSVIIIILSGVKYITANGDSNSINSAKNTLLYALVGIVITLIAQSIIVFIVSKVK